MPADPGLIAAGLSLGGAGAVLIVIYTLLNREARRMGAGAHWAAGWVMASLGMTGMGVGWGLLCLAGPRIELDLLPPLGGLISLTAGAIYVASARWVGRWRTRASYSLGLTTSGIYRHVRHPQALSLSLLAVGVGLLTGSIPYLLSVPLWVGFWTAYTFLEERNELIPAFGDAYLRYREEVPRLIPRLLHRRGRGRD